MQNPKDKAVAFTTTYRAETILRDIEDKNLRNVIYTELYRIISELYKQGYTYYYSGMAEGIDMLAANAVLDLKEEHPDICFVAVVPFQWQQERYSTTGRNDYKTICSEADEVVRLAEEIAENDFYARRNDYLLENCSAMVCYHDGQCDVMTYTYNQAERAGIPIINIYDQLSGYLANESQAKKIFQSYSGIESFSYCKEGIMLPQIGDEPLIIPFEEIAAVENRKEMLYLTLHNQMLLHTSLFMDDCEVWFPGMDEPAGWQNMAVCYAQLKEWVLSE